MSKKLTIEECILVAQSKNGECLSTKYTNNYTKMLWKCEKDHIWKAKFGNIKFGQWCPFCSKNFKSVPQDRIDYAESKNGKCLSTEYKNSKEKLQWECEHGHKWMSSFFTMKYQGHWCPHCSKNARLTLEDCIKLAKNKNGKCLSTKYKNAREKLQWECEYGHKWFAPIYSIKAGCWCKHCAGLIKLTLNDCKKVAQDRGGKCLSTEYKNNQTLMEWECDKQHQWTNNLGHIKGGQWCPVCSRGKSQRELFNIVSILFPHYIIKYNFRGLSWLKTKNNGFQELDIYVPELKLAIEYDGIQHFKPVKYFGGDEKFKTQKKMDHLKNTKIKQHPEDVKYFVRFNYREKITKEYVIKKLSQIINGINSSIHPILD